MPRRAILFGAALLFLCCVSAQAQSVRQDLDCTNGTVNTTIVSGNLLYIGGEFTYVGSAAGPCLPIDAATGQAPLSFARVTGSSINAIVPDGAGGWYIGGFFTLINGIPRSNIAHVL